MLIYRKEGYCLFKYLTPPPPRVCVCVCECVCVMMAALSPLHLGFDFSTQQVKLFI